MLVGHFVLVLATKVDLLDKPRWFAEVGYMDGATQVFMAGFNPFVEYWSYKPPLLFLLTALGFELFGLNMTVAHGVIALFSVAALFYTFLLGRALYGDLVGVVASLLLYASASFFAGSELFVAGVPMVALVLATVYHYQRGHLVGYLVAASLMVLLKEPALIVIGCVALNEALVALLGLDRRCAALPLAGRLRRGLWRGALFFSPVLIFVAWMIANRVFMGWFLWPHNASFFSDLTFPGYGLRWILSSALWNEYKFVLLVPLLLVGVHPMLRQRLVSRQWLLYGLLLLFTVLFYWMQCGPLGGDKDYFPLTRYYLYLLPLFLILGTAAVVAAAPNKGLALVYLLMFLVLTFLTWTPRYLEENGETDLNQRFMAQTNGQAAAFIERHYGHGIIFTDLVIANLRNPSLGYVTRTLSVQPGIAMAHRGTKYLDKLLRDHPNTPIVLTYSWWRYPHSSKHGYELQTLTPLAEFIKANPKSVQRVRRIDDGPEVIEIYRAVR